MLNYSPASENNKRPILARLADYLGDVPHLLEIGSGSGQHAVFFARQLPGLSWQPSELDHSLAALKANIRDHAPDNVLPPLRLDVCHHPWPLKRTHAVYTANTLHIMPWSSVIELFRGSGRVLAPAGLMCIYGPFKYAGEFTTPSNAEFDRWLRQQDQRSGIRDFESVEMLAGQQDLKLVEDFAMPANNQLLIFKHQAST